ncbi:oxidoreductase [Salinivibrio siamensis]|uniref:Oxidoreductase n=1 Tax=Salinivibrio siamensis TaxID=414286 RepID=A0ABX3K534_9GAMM|nr:Gfo/Idh/MocA family oxidoreductase [Salinivibrio siamensis]OOE79728.1 oxidoreductase [Salinivibrio siamensis]
MERIAVIGLGNIAIRHRRNLKQLFPNAKLYAMSASGRIPQEPVNDADYIVASIDALIEQQPQLVIVASPATFHTLHATPLIKVGIPILIEKPVTSNLDDLKQLEEAANQNKTPLAVGFCMRYLSSAVEMKRLLDSGILGQLYHAHIEVGQYLPDWRPNKDYRESVSARSDLGGGALLELSHELDYAQWLLGKLTLEHAILRRGDELGLDVEDSADMLLSTDQQAVVHLHLDFLQRKPYRQCRFVGSKGVLEWDLIGNEIRLVSTQGDQVLYSEPTWDKNKMYTTMVSDFIRLINDQPNHSVSFTEAAQSITLIEQIKRRYPITVTSDEVTG